MIQPLRVLLLAGVLAAFISPCRANADPNLGVPFVPTGASGPPVEIDECKLLYSGNEVAGESAGVKMKFTNDSKQTADLINFRVVAGSESGTIRDVGTFTPGVEITHQYREGSGHLMFSPLVSHVHLDCAVASVHFTDGSVWQAPAVTSVAVTSPAVASTPLPSAPRKQLVSAPNALSFAGVGREYDQFVSLYSHSGLRALRQSGTCGGIVTVRTVEMGRRSAALRVSPVAKGRCTITVVDEASRSVDIPVDVGSIADAPH